MSDRKKPDPLRLKPGRLVHLLNSTPLGPVIDDRWLHAHPEHRWTIADVRREERNSRS
ncbi:MAG: hypothetical protein ACK6CE_10500 [Planctomycetota bacterium]